MPKRSPAKRDFRDYGDKGRKIKKSEEGASSSSSNVDEELVSGVLAEESEALYHLALNLEKNAIIVLDKNATKIYLRDFNLRRKVLWDTRYVYVERKVVRFKIPDLPEDQEEDEECCQWIYACSCNQRQTSIVSALSSNVNITFKEWSELNPDCLHIKILSSAMKRFDAMFSLAPVHDDQHEEDETNSETGNELPFVHVSPRVICVKPPELSWGIVANVQRMQCLTCTHTNSCGHVKFITQSLDSDECPEFIAEFCDLQGSGNQQRSQWQAKCLSYKTVPFTSTGTLASLFESSSEATVFDASTEIVRCPFCDAEPVVCNQAAKEVIMFTQYKRVKVNVFSASTSNCSHLIPFDGSGNGVLNMKEFLVGHDVLRDYLFNFLHGRMPLFTFYECWKQRQVDAGHGKEEMLPYNKFRMAWYSFLSLISEDFNVGFYCPICKDSPSVVLFDATGLAFRRSYVPRRLLDNSNSEALQTGRQTRSR